MPTEAQLRDVIAKNLALIEPRMELVRTEFPLPNAAGTRGFIDILARDGYGHYVVIEIKRSNATARQALHELHKYTELLRAELKIAAENIRCVLISTTWSELTRPFASFVRDTPYSVLGLLVEVDDNATEVRLTVVPPLTTPTSVRLTAVSEILFFTTDSQRNAEFARLSPALTAMGCPHHVGIRLNRELPFAGFPFSLYLVLGSISPNDEAVRVLDYLTEDVPDDSVEAPRGAVWEYRALCHLAMQEISSAASVETAYPEKFRYVTSSEGKWSVVGIERAGAFNMQRSALSDEAICDTVGGEEGLSEILYYRRSSPRFPAAWRALRRDAQLALVGNTFWTQALNLWLDEVEMHCPSDDVLLHIFNPTNFIRPLVHYDPDQYVAGAPSLNAAVGAPDEETFRWHIQGELVWDGTTTPSVLDCAQSVYAGSVWMAAMLPVDTSLDLDLLAQLGLRYGMFEVRDSKPPVLVEVDNNRLVRIPHDDVGLVTKDDDVNVAVLWHGSMPFGTFLNARTEEVAELWQEIRNHQIHRGLD